VLGQVCVTLLQLASQYLNEFYDAPSDLDNPSRTLLTGDSEVLSDQHLPRNAAFVAAATTLALGAGFTVLLARYGHLGLPDYLILGVAFVLSIGYSVPPLRLAGSGYGELAVSIVVANLVPAFAFLIQTGELHRLLAMTTFPLTSLHLAMLLAFSLPDYASDLKQSKRSLMIRAGWEMGMSLHNVLILLAFLLLVVGTVALGLPWRIIWPALLVLPVGVFQIWQMLRISQGGKPRWSLLTFTAMVTFALTAYLLTFSFWTG
jgi:1,4-dihydroxy-2-naphthoate octaprenyltransferase